jgi:autotransporter-associated beta strand protein
MESPMKTAIPTQIARLSLALTALALLLATGQSQAQTWIGGTDNTTSNTANWKDGVLPAQPAANLIIYFDSATNLTPNNDYLEKIRDLRFAAASDGMVLSGDAMELGAPSKDGGTANNLVVEGDPEVTINLNLRFMSLNTTSHRSITMSDAGKLTINGEISSNNAFEIVKTGDNSTLILTNANTFSGGLRNNGGTIYLNNTTGSATGTGRVRGGSAAVYGGSGSFSGNYSGSGTIRPGATGNGDIGTLTAGANVTWSPNETLPDSLKAWEFDLETAADSLASAAAGDSTQDQLSIGGDFIKNTGTGSTFNFDFLGGGEEGWYKLVDWAGTTDFVGSDFGATNLDSGLTGSFTIDSGALYLNVIPEPSSVALLLGGLGALALLRRRRRS